MHFDVFVDEIVEVVVNQILGRDDDSLRSPLDRTVGLLEDAANWTNPNVVAIDTEVLNGPGNACILSYWNRNSLCDSRIAQPTHNGQGHGDARAWTID